jgi:hypothetical protein
MDSARKENRKDVLSSYIKARINIGNQHDPRLEFNAVLVIFLINKLHKKQQQ